MPSKPNPPVNPNPNDPNPIPPPNPPPQPATEPKGDDGPVSEETLAEYKRSQGR